jgi:hypothetical protein
MRQILVLSAEDFLMLRQGQALALEVGDQTISLMIEATAPPRVMTNGAGPEPHPAPRGKKPYAPRRQYTDAEKRQYLAQAREAVATAPAAPPVEVTPRTHRRRSFTDAQKRKILAQIAGRKKDMSQGAAIRKAGIGDGLYRYWRQEFGERGDAPLKRKKG